MVNVLYMNFQLFGKDKAPTLLLIPCLGVSYEIFEGMNHGQLLIDHPEEIVQRIIQLTLWNEMPW